MTPSFPAGGALHTECETISQSLELTSSAATDDREATVEGSNSGVEAALHATSSLSARRRLFERGSQAGIKVLPVQRICLCAVERAPNASTTHRTMSTCPLSDADTPGCSGDGQSGPNSGVGTRTSDPLSTEQTEDPAVALYLLRREHGG